MKALFVVFLCLTTVFGCGVKGDPMPPESGAILGRGVPKSKGDARASSNQGQTRIDEEEEDEDEDEK